MNYINYILVGGVFLITLILTGGTLIYMKKTGAPVRTNVVQLIGLYFFIPLILALSLFDKIDANVISTLLGVFVGYIFGKEALKEEWANTKQGQGQG